MAQDERTKDTNLKTKSGSKDQTKSREQLPTKVIVRRLPPTMSEDVFLEQIAPLPENNYFYYTKGKQKVGVPTFSRAYINFVNQEDIFIFQNKFDGYVFLDQKGNEYTAIVEFAPYQKIPKPKEALQLDDKCNTIENDNDYLEFIKKIENPEEVVLPSAETYLEQIEQKEKEMRAGGFLKVSTPLVEFIQQRRLEREKFREEKKEERRKKELEKKKLREAERLKKRDGRREKEEKNREKQTVKSNKETEKSAIKVLKNKEREEKMDQEAKKKETISSEPCNAVKKFKDTSRLKEKSKEKFIKEKVKQKPVNDRIRANEKDKPVENKETIKKEDVKKSEPTKEMVHIQIEKTGGGVVEVNKKEVEEEEGEGKGKEKEGEKERDKDRERRIRNKDRPDIPLYRPGAKRQMVKQGETAADGSNGTKKEVKTRTFIRSTPKE